MSGRFNIQIVALIVILAVAYLVVFLLVRRFLFHKYGSVIHGVIPVKKQLSAVLLFDAICLLSSLFVGYFGLIIAGMIYAEGGFFETLSNLIHESPFSIVTWIFIPLAVFVLIQYFFWGRLSKNSCERHIKMKLIFYGCSWLLVPLAFCVLMLTLAVITFFIIVLFSAVAHFTCAEVGVNKDGEICQVL